jgi:hypothetical protein
MGEKISKFVINIPEWVDWLIVLLILLYRRLHYGYAFKRIPLTRGKFAIVDTEDYARLATYKWHLAIGTSSSYAARWHRSEHCKQRKKIWMHRQIISVPEGMVCDHINRNGLDNRKANLRPATVSQNLSNRAKRKTKTRSKYKGLEWDRIQRKWKARIQMNNRKIYIGAFDNEREAAKAYDKKARQLFKEFACLNFPEHNNPQGKPFDPAQGRPEG